MNKQTKTNLSIDQWGYEQLLSLGYVLKNKTPEIVQQTPWSYVVRFKTNDGLVYLKQMPEQLSLEAEITKILHDQFDAPVPVVLAPNDQLHCFLMKDAGVALRSLLKNTFDVDLFCKAINQFAEVQLAVADHAKIFLDIGVPDWRLDKLIDLYAQLLCQNDILIADGLAENEITDLQKLLPTVSALCDKLSSYAIQPTLVQCDFHDNNILVNESTHAITFIDLGEIVIAHPFFSLNGCLWQARKHHGLTSDDEAYKQLLVAGLKPFEKFETMPRLLEALELVNRVWLMYGALAQYRLRLACDQAAFLSYQQHGKLAGALKEFLATCRAVEGHVS
ncbi:MAG: aminoglycoside phosphotransferase family protein [Coxiellaceae bacterium]|nr:aminoglycoside phosphotransferase family protein [Coxiellaceae bacterium]